MTRPRHEICGASIVFIAALAACGGDDGTTDAAPADAAPSDAPAADAPVPDAAAVDATEIDASLPDAAIPDAASPIVTVRFLGRAVPGGEPGPGIHVLAHDPDGRLFGRVLTDAAGVASIAVPEGGSVTVVEESRRKLTTILAASGGDMLTVGDVGYWTHTGATATLTLPTGPRPGVEYIVQGPCALSGFSASRDVLVNLWDGCAGGATRPVVAIAYDVQFPALLRGYIYDPAAELTSGSAATIHGTWTSPIDFRVHLTGLPTPLSSMSLNVYRYTAGERVYLWQGGSSIPSGSEVEGSALLAGGGDASMTQLYLGGEHEIVEYRAGTVTSLESDVTADLISRPTDVSIVQGELEPGGRRGFVGTTWTMSGAGDHDGVVVVFEDETLAPRRWITVAPPTAVGRVELRLPALPTDLVGLWAGDSLDRLTIEAVDSPAVSYAQFRRDADPQRPWSYMLRPSGPSKTRIGRGQP